MAQQEFLKLLNDYNTNPARTLVEWQRQLNHILNNLTNGDYVTTSAVNTSLTDAGSYYPTNNVEAALQYVGSILLAISLTASRLVATNASGKLVSVSALSSWIAGTTNRITITDDGDGTITISAPQDLHTDADVEFDSIKLDDLTASRMVSADGTKKLVSIAALSSWIAGTTNRITITDDGDGTITISAPQDLDTGASVTFANVTASTLVKGATGQFGNVAGGNYSEFETDGTLKFNGNATVYNDLPPIPLIAARLGAANNPSLATLVGNIQVYSFGINDYVYGVQEILHEYKEGSNIDIHIHWVTNGSEVGDTYVNWECEYSIANLDNSAPYTATGSAFSSSTVLTTGNTKIPGGTPDRAHIYTDIGTDITGTNYKIGAIICYRFRRIANTAGAANPAANPFALQLGFHIEQDTVGSRQEYIK
jgi:hypothetical protein